MLLVIHDMITFIIFDHSSTADDLEENIVVSFKEMNNAMTGEIRLSFFLFNQWSHRVGPAVRSKPMRDGEIDHIIF
jgi:hypothetical protein